MENNEEAILDFWRWFVHNEQLIQECIEDEHSEDREFVVDQMNEFILSFGMLTWDLGLDDDDNWFLMLSPNGNADMLKVSQKIMDFAPDHTSWMFYSSRPATNWDRIFTMYDQEMDVLEINASAWHYVLFDDETDDTKFELHIEANSISALHPEDIEAVAEQFVTKEIGEATRIMHISDIVVVHAFDSDLESLKASVAVLNAHLDELL